MERELMKSGRPLTGRLVLFMLLAFFGVVITVNLVMFRLASATFSGLRDKNAYVAGINHNKALAAAREQARRGWKVDAHMERVAAGRSLVNVARADGGAFASLDVTVRFRHPATETLDRAVVLAPAGPNAWRGAIDLPAGVWDMVIEMRSAGSIVFLSRDRITASDSKINDDG
ncbi:MAG: FixH family protein [Beijerinckiaceae bacterium]